MNYVKTLVNRKVIVLTVLQFAVLAGAATVAPLIGQQAITGPIVNATLFIAVVLLGAQNAILVGLVPSVIALSVGLLPAILAPMVPFIMISNTVLILVFNSLKKHFWVGVIAASLLKFLFLFATSSLVINLLLKKEIAQKVAAMMSWPQLLTALGGGIIAYLFLKSIKKF